MADKKDDPKPNKEVQFSENDTPRHMLLKMGKKVDFGAGKGAGVRQKP